MPQLMKGHTWKDHAHKMTYPCDVEAKVDEVRCHAIREGTEVIFISYAEKPLYNLEQFKGPFAQFMLDLNLTELDLGFEANRNFDDSRRWVRSSKNFPKDLVGAPVRFILFAVPTCTEPHSEFRHLLDTLAGTAWLYGIPMERPKRRRANNAEEVTAIYLDYREEGHEGAMVKNDTHLYERGKRIYGWLKYKPEEDASGIIVAVHEAVCQKDQPEKDLRVGDRLGRVGSVTIDVYEDGVCVGQATAHGIDHKLGKHMLENPQQYIGQWAEFKYMMRDTAGGYRHPTWHRLREAQA